MTEAEQLARAKRQLTIVGVVCVTIIVFMLWLTHLDENIAYLNKKSVPLPLESFQAAEKQLGPQWQALKQRLHNPNF